MVSVNAVFDGTRFEKFEAELGFRFRPKHLLDVPEDEEVYLEAIQSCGFLLNEWTEKQGHWLSREEAIKQVINFNREAKRKPCHDLRWAVCVEIGQAFENELITCEMTSLVVVLVTACALNPRRDELSIARALRAASRTAMPNIRIVSLADRMLGRNGRMVAAIESIGPGMSAYASEPFQLDLE